MSFSSAMEGVAQGNSLHVDLAVMIAVLPGRLLQKIEREIVKGKARQRADKKVAIRRMRRIISSHLRQAEASPADFIEGVPASASRSRLDQQKQVELLGVTQASLHAGKVKREIDRRAKNSSFSPSIPFNSTNPVQPLPTPPLPPPLTPIPQALPTVTASELKRKIARLEAELHTRDRSRQKRNDAFRSLKISEHTKMLELMDANDYIHRLEAELEKTKKKNVSWVHRAEKYKAERYEKFAPFIDQISSTPPRAVEWGILARQLEFWAGVVALILLIAAVYAVGKYLGNAAPAVSSPPSSKLVK